MNELRANISHAQWLRHPFVKQICTLLGEGNARFVGGAVRDALMGQESRDIDIATRLEPNFVVERLKGAGLDLVLAGLDHGTVMAHKGAYCVEITTLRKDTETDGRRATVVYIDDWQQDAERRDLTVNAIYADPTGALFDPVGGVEDLRTGQIRFIGDTRKRIDEDALRILRFFRFYALLGKGAVDKVALGHIREKVGKVKTLSSERVRNELIKTLSAADPMSAILMMDEAGLLDILFGDRPNLSTLAHMLESETIVPDPLRRLAALLPASLGAVEDFSDQFRLSGLQKKRLLSVAAARIELEGNRMGLRAMQYEYGRANLRDALIIDRPRLLPSWQIITEVVFPLQGRDLVEMGFSPGPEMGRLLESAKRRWLDSDCRHTRAELMDFIKAEARSFAAGRKGSNGEECGEPHSE